MYFLGLDIGTTRMKCGIYDREGEAVYFDSCDYGEKKWTDETYIDIEGIYDNALEMLKRAYANTPFDSVAISSLGESFALLDGDDRVLFLPMLYTDPRGESEAEALSGEAERIFAISGVYPQSMYSAYKLLWIKNNRPEIYERAEKLFLVGEYVGYRLTGVRAVDCSLAARTGIFDIRKMEFSEELCELFGIDKALFSPVCRSGEVIGELSAAVKEHIGAKASLKLVAGGHDQIMAAIGAGAVSEGVCADGMGTVECLTVPYKNAFDSCEMGMYGYPNVPHGVRGLYCTYLLNLSCGSLVDWWLGTAFRGVEREDIYAEAEKDISDEPTGLLVLPYFGGASTPYQNINAKGAIVNLKLSDTRSRVYQGIYEGLAMEMRLNLELTEKHGVKPKRIVATGGCSASRKALQIKSDIFGLPVYPLKIKEAGICGCAMLGVAALTGEELLSVAKRFVKLGDPLEPRADIHRRYEAEYEKYKELYLTLKKFY